jgi:hypothetical protein
MVVAGIKGAETNGSDLHYDSICESVWLISPGLNGWDGIAPAIVVVIVPALLLLLLLFIYL